MSKSIHIEIGESYAGLTVRIGNVNGSIEHSNITAEEVLDDIMREIRDVFGVSENMEEPRTIHSVDKEIRSPKTDGKTSMASVNNLPKSENIFEHKSQ